MSVLAVTSIGIGAMVGAGIFALIGQAALVAGQEVWLSFVIGGVIALFSGYSFARLGTRFASAEGAVGYFKAGFGGGVVAATFSLTYMLTLLVSVAMVARTFGAYADRLFLGLQRPGIWTGVFAVAVIVAMTIVNMISATAAGRVETLLVAVKLVILATLAGAGLYTLDPQMLDPHAHVSAPAMLSAVGFTFLAYAGYGTMANAGASVAAPEKTIPRATFLAIGMTIVLYVSLSLVLLGNLSPAELVRYADTAVAQAARPVLGDAGFTVVSIGALLATASAVNGTLFGALRIANGLADEGRLPAAFDMRIWQDWTRGILICVLGVIVLALAFDLSTIASAAGAAFLFTYLGIQAAAWWRRREIGANAVAILLGMLGIAIVLVVFVSSLWTMQRNALWMCLALVCGSGLLQLMLRRRAASVAHAAMDPGPPTVPPREG